MPSRVGYWAAGPPPGVAELFEAADRAGVDQIWTAEAYGSDAWTPLAWWGSRTTRIQLGTAVSQLSARPPVTLAMTAMTMDHLTQGRILLGIGTSNPQVVEGWYGQPYPRPLERTREYIDIVRQVIARAEPVSYDGKHYQLPLTSDQSTGPGQAAALHPAPVPHRDPHLPRRRGPEERGAGGRDRRRLERHLLLARDERLLRRGPGRRLRPPGARHTAETFDVVGGPLAIIEDDDLERAADHIRPTLALYIGGMGARGVNFHHEVFVRMGYEAEASKIQDLYLAGDKRSAIAAVPTALVEDVALIGPWAKITEEIQRWKQTVLTTFAVHANPRDLPRIADLIR